MAQRTKRSYAEQVQRILEPRLKPETKLNIREVESAVSIVRDQVATVYLNQLVWQNELGIFGDFVSHYTATVKEDTERNLTYVELPVRPLDIAKNYGIYQVYSNLDRLFIPVNNSFSFLYGNSYASDLEGLDGYFYEGNNIYFTNDQEVGQTIKLNIVAVSDDLNSFDNFPVAPSIVKDVIAGAVDLLRIEKSIPEDTINDEIDLP